MSLARAALAGSLFVLLGGCQAATTAGAAASAAAPVDCEAVKAASRAGGQGVALEPVVPAGPLVQPAFPTTPDVPRQGRVAVKFTVDTTGVVIPEQVQVVEATHPAFAEAARAALAQWRFRSAYLVGSGCKVEQLVDHTFTFGR